MGGLRATHGSRVVTRFGTRKTGLLLAYLAYHRRRAHSREALIELLWPGCELQAGRQSLRKALTSLRRQLEREPVDQVPEGSGGQPGTESSSASSLDDRASLVFLIDRASVQLDPTVSTDVEELKAALRSAARADGAEQAQWLVRAVEPYRGELLSGHHDDWIVQERPWLAESYFEALGQLLAHLEREGSYRLALQYAQRGVSADPLREETHRDLMRLYLAVGQPAAALGQYRELERLLKEQLQATPNAATRALAAEIERLAIIQPQPLAPPRFAVSRPTDSSWEPPLAHPEGEKRLLTVLFADMSSSLQRTAGLNAEDAAELINQLLTAMVDVLLKYEGRIDRFLGDGVLALFGTPQAHEDDPERAIRAALGIRAAARRLDLEVTAGINSGEVYIGHIGSKQYQEMTVVGPVVSLAARLQGSAEPGQILVGEATYLQTRRAFEYSSRSLAIKGLTDPVAVYAVERALARPEKTRGIEGMRAELIGRDEELAKLEAMLGEVMQGHGRIVSLIGEAGLGKSRLVAELKHRVSGRMWDIGPEPIDPTPYSHSPTPLWLEGRCLELGMTTGYSLFVDLLRDYFAWRPEDEEPGQGERLVASLRELVERGALAAGRIEEIGPLLGHVFSLRFGSDWDDRLRNGSPQQIKEQTLLAVRDFFLALTISQPIVLVLEDLHWADSRSLEIIASMLETVAFAPIMLLCVYRPEQEHRCRQLGTTAERKCPEQYTEIRLQELTPEQSRRLVESLLATEALPGWMKDQILERSRGNPFYLEEVVRSLIAGGALYQEGRVWRARERDGEAKPGDSTLEAAGHQAESVPESIRSVILSRVDRLRPELKQVLQRASVIGRLFRLRLLEWMVGAEIELARALWELEDRELIYRERLLPEEEYSFNHVLTQETVYGSLLMRPRAAFHQRVAEAIEALYPEGLDAYYEQLAYHYEQSGADEKAVEYLLKAGEKARRAYLNDEAVSYLQRALERREAGAAERSDRSARSVGEEGREGRLAAPERQDLELRGRIVNELALAYSAQGRSDQCTALLEGQIERCRQGGCPAEEARACYWLAGELLGLNAAHAGSLGSTRIERLLQRAVDLSVRNGLEDWIVRPLLDLAFHYWALRQNLPAQERILTALALDLDRLTPEVVRQVLTMLMGVRAAQGRWEEVRALFTLALAHGGTVAFHLHLFLAEWEEQLEREGRHEWFVEMCREMQAQALAAGIRIFPSQWYLEAVQPAPTGGRPFLDVSFSTEPLPQALGWVDPAGVGTPELQPGRPLMLAPPPGPNLWPRTNLNAPRLMLSVEGDFVAETRVEIGAEGELFAGLLLWGSAREFIRLERVRTGPHGNGVHLEACAGGSYLYLGRGCLSATAVWLRLERTGTSVRALCSEDRKKWWTCGAATFPEGGRAQLGLACVAHTAGATASFERFTVWR